MYSVIYELKEGGNPPRMFANPSVPPFAFAGKRASLWRRCYDEEGYVVSSRRLSVAKYGAILKRLRALRKSRGYAQLQVVEVRRTSLSPAGDETPWGASVGYEPNEEEASAMCAEYEPTSELVIDDSRYVVNFYDVFYVLRVYGKAKDGSWEVAYETPQADPKPHAMDW